MEKKVCPQCGKEFETNYSKKIYCSNECQIEAKLLKRREANKAKLFLKTCPHCRHEFAPKRVNQIYCSDKCRIANKNFHVYTIKNCPYCGKEFIPKRVNQIFCSHKCSVKYYFNAPDDNLAVAPIQDRSTTDLAVTEELTKKQRCGEHFVFPDEFWNQFEEPEKPDKYIKVQCC